MKATFFSSVAYKFFTVIAIVALALVALPTQSVQAAHTFDTSVRFTGNGNPLTQSYTVGSGGTLLVVSIVGRTNVARTGGAPTYNGVALTQADETRGTGVLGSETTTELWYLVSPPTGAAHNISIPNAGVLDLYAIASSYSAQAGFTSAFDVANGNVGTTANPSVSVTTTANGDIIVGAMGNGNNAAPSADNGTTLFSTANGAAFSDNGQYFLQATAGAQALNWTVTANDWAVVVAAFKEIPLVAVTIDQAAAQADPANTSPINFTVVFSAATTNFATGDVTLSGTAGATTATVTGSGTTYNVAVNGMTGDGTVIATIAAGVATDAASTPNSASTSTDNAVTYDTTTPTVTINQAVGQADPTNASPINFTVVFSEAVSGFVAADVTLSSGTAIVTGGPTIYTVTVSGMAQGILTASLPAGAAVDAAGNTNVASTSTDNQVTYDSIAPTVTINQAGGQADPTNTSPINFTVVFSAATTNFATGDVTLSGTAGATTATVTGSGTTYNVAVSGMTGNGTVIADIAAGVSTDAAGNSNTASTSTDNTVTYDTLALTVTIDQAAAQADPANTSPINFTVVFSAATTNFATGDVTLSGTAGATTATVTGSGTTYNVAVSGMTGDGTVIATIAAGVATDAASTPNSASTSTDNTVTYDTTTPTVTINQAVGQADPTNASPINFTVVFSEATTNFATGDVTLSGTAGATTATVTGSGMTYNVAVSGMTSSGTVIATIAAGVATDTAGNNNTASTSTDNTVTYDAANPTVVSTDLTASYTGTGPGSFIATFSKAVDDPAGNTGTDDVTNTANYLLVNKGTNGVANTVSCVGGVMTDDTQVIVTSVSYNTVTFQAKVTLVSPLPVGSYRLFICGTTSIVDLAGNPLNGGTDYTFDFVVQAVQQQGGGSNVSASQQTSLIPDTGFSQNKITTLPIQPADKVYASTDLWLEIPKLGVKMAIVGVPKTKDGWDVTWLNKDAGWLNGSAYPTWNGNSVITAHVWDALNKPGPFAQLKSLKYGDQVKIHAFGMVYTYEITESSLITNADAKLAFKHEAKPVITLITCEDYNETSDTYTYRRMVRAVLVSVTKEK